MARLIWVFAGRTATLLVLSWGGSYILNSKKNVYSMHNIIHHYRPTNWSSHEMSAILDLPSILVEALRGFDFVGKPLWRLSEGLTHVKVELTFKLRELDDQPIDQPARAVRKPAARGKKRGQRQRQRQPAIQQQPPPRETAPPTIETSPAPPPATISFQRPATTKTLAPALTSIIQRPLSPATIQKQPT